MSDLDFRTFDVDADPDLVRGWHDAMVLGFLGAGADDAAYARVLECWRQDRPSFTGVYAPSRFPGLPASMPVATFATYERTINTGGGTLTPALFITDVTVRTTARRQGILRRLMTDALAGARERGLALAALTASEGGIYGRFGFGVSTRWQKAELTTDGRFALTHPADDRVEIVPSRGAADTRRAVFKAFHRSHRGSHERLSFYEPLLSGAWDFDRHAPDPRRRTVVHYTPAGTPDGIAAWSFDEDAQTLRVADLLAVDDAAELALWQFLGSVDLAHKAVARRLCPTSPLPWALADPRLLRLTESGDFTWLRILDVARALAARSFDSDGDLVLRVVDPLGWAAGTYRVVVRDGRAEVTPAAGHPDAVSVDAAALASLYLGVADARTLAGAGLVAGPSDAVAALARLFRTDIPPHNASGF